MRRIVRRMKNVMHEMVEKLKRENSDVRRTVQSMLDRGFEAKRIDEEIGRAYLGCLWEAWGRSHLDQLSDRLPQVLAALAEGKSTEAIFAASNTMDRPDDKVRADHF
jgi:hypothetical protein